MSEKLMRYFATEYHRLTDALAAARSRGDDAETNLLERLRAITEDQLARWSADLAPDRAVSQPNIAA